MPIAACFLSGDACCVSQQVYLSARFAGCVVSGFANWLYSLRIMCPVQLLFIQAVLLVLYTLSDVVLLHLMIAVSHVTLLIRACNTACGTCKAI